jgi:hypothetical protein
LKNIGSMSTRLKVRFHQAVHRRISMQKALGDEATHEEKIYDGPWADSNAKFLHSIATKNQDQKDFFDEATERKYPRSWYQRLISMNGQTL